MLRFGVLVTLATSACYRPTLHDCAVTCNSGTCPSGLSCKDNFCRTGDSEDSCNAILDASQDSDASSLAQQAYIKATNTRASAAFGFSVAISVDGNTAVVGSQQESSSSTTIDMGGDDTLAPGAGAAYVYQRDRASNWQPLTYLKASNTNMSDLFGTSVAISADGTTIAVGAIGESSDSIGVGGDQVNNNAKNAGAVYIFLRSGGTWIKQAYIKASNTGAGDNFGASVALSADGSILVVGAPAEASAGTGTMASQGDNSAANAGAVYTFHRLVDAWSQVAYLKSDNTKPGAQFGTSVTLSSDGTVLAVGSQGESSNETGVHPTGGLDMKATASGAVYVFSFDGAMWSQDTYIKASNTATSAHFGTSVSLSQNGKTLAVGADAESGGSTGIGGDGNGTGSAPSSGAVYVFQGDTASWSQQVYIKASNAEMLDQFGHQVALSPAGSELVVGAIGEASTATGVDGDAADNRGIDRGAAYRFTTVGTDWIQRDYVKASFTGDHYVFGGAVAVAGDGTFVIGSSGEASSASSVGGDDTKTDAPNAGAVYAFH